MTPVHQITVGRASARRGVESSNKVKGLAKLRACIIWHEGQPTKSIAYSILCAPPWSECFYLTSSLHVKYSIYTFLTPLAQDIKYQAVWIYHLPEQYDNAFEIIPEDVLPRMNVQLKLCHNVFYLQSF